MRDWAMEVNLRLWYLKQFLDSYYLQSEHKTDHVVLTPMTTLFASHEYSIEHDDHQTSLRSKIHPISSD
jgi:hypothetical protein